MARRFGIPPASAREQVHKMQIPAASEAFRPLPTPTGKPPFRAAPGDVGITESTPLRFFVLGDTGGIMNPQPQNHVSNAMQAAPDRPDFVYIVGDVVYFNGDEADYPSQFYEPYAHLNAPIIAIPGNHDGDNSDAPAVPSLTGFMTNLCAPAPRLPAGAEEYQRDTETQPNCYWTLRCAVLTIIGCYDNVPEGGVIEADQAAWLTSELAAAPRGVPLIVALHHPPYSADAFHGGSARMGQVLDAAFASAGRTPDLVLSGHVHNYQRFTRTTPSGRAIPYVVSGNGGYHNLHRLARDAAAGVGLTDGVTFEFGDDVNWGFLTCTSDGTILRARYTSVAGDGTVTPGADTWTAGGAA